MGIRQFFRDMNPVASQGELVFKSPEVNIWDAIIEAGVSPEEVDASLAKAWEFSNRAKSKEPIQDEPDGERAGVITVRESGIVEFVHLPPTSEAVDEQK